jgi:hypothetical protein
VNDGNVRAFIDDYLVLRVDCTHERIPASPQPSCMLVFIELEQLVFSDPAQPNLY